MIKIWNASFPLWFFCGGENKACQVPHRASPYEILTQILTACCYLNFHLKIITKTIWVEGLEDVSKWKYVNHNNFGLLYLAESPQSPGFLPVAFAGWFPMLQPQSEHRSSLCLAVLHFRWWRGIDWIYFPWSLGQLNIDVTFNRLYCCRIPQSIRTDRHRD